MINQDSRSRAIQAKKSPCGCWLHFLVGQKQSLSQLPPCNFEEMPYVARTFSLSVNSEIVDIVFIEIYRIH